VDPTIVCQKVVQGVFAGVTTTQLDNLAAETAAYMSTTHPGAYRVGTVWWMKKKRGSPGWDLTDHEHLSRF